MKNITKIVILTVVAAFLSVIVLSAQEHNHNHKADKNKTSEKMMDFNKIDKNKDGFVYECPMKCEAPKDVPGECSKCGMKLQKMSIKDMGKKMMDKGKMMKNKMNHEKMKQKKNMKDHKGMMNKEVKMKSMDNINGMTGGMVHKGWIDVKSIDKNKDGKVFQDMMDWNVISDKSGDCPVCGMKLKEVSIDEAKHNLNKHGFETK